MTKVKKEEYGYVEGDIHCKDCGFYLGDKCKLVKGDIDGQIGVCVFWTSQGNEVHEPEFEKTEALYIEVPPSGTRCGSCYFFQPPNGCELVEGQIDGQNGCCIAWKEKEGSTESNYSKIFKMTRLT